VNEDIIFARAAIRVFKAWQLFQASHDVTAAKLACCERSVELFNALEELEKVMSEMERGFFLEN